jgi:hypothetical protein
MRANVMFALVAILRLAEKGQAVINVSKKIE